MSFNTRDYVSDDHIESIGEIAKSQSAIIQALSLENSKLETQLQQKEKSINKAIKKLNKYRNRKDAHCLWCMDYGDNAEVIKILGGEVRND